MAVEQKNIGQSELIGLIGQTIEISPRMELNRGRLFTLQSWIDPEKLSKALIYGNEAEDIPITALVSIEKKQIVLTLMGGNHRTGVAWSLGTEISLKIVGLYKGQKRWGFNKIAQKVRSQLR